MNANTQKINTKQGNALVWVIVLILIIIAAGLAFASFSDNGDGGDKDTAMDTATGTRSYSVEITNLTDSQPFSPGVIATHEASMELFETGTDASEGIQTIAEDGKPDVAVSALEGLEEVSDVTTIDMPIHREGGPGTSTRSFTITADDSANEISLAVMAICTNDGFTGISGTPLPSEVGATTTEETPVYDAGTEANEETFDTLVGPCGAAGPVKSDSTVNNHTDEDKTIRLHPGISGSGELTEADHGWTDPVARITITRTE